MFTYSVFQNYDFLEKVSQIFLKQTILYKTFPYVKFYTDYFRHKKSQIKVLTLKYRKPYNNTKCTGTCKFVLDGMYMFAWTAIM